MKNSNQIIVEIQEIKKEIDKWAIELDKAIKTNPDDYVFINQCHELVLVLKGKIIALKWVLRSNR